MESNSVSSKSDHPAIPLGLLTAIKQRQCVAFLGTGISLDAGAPNWEELIKKLVRFACDKGFVTESESDDLQEMIRAREFPIVADIVTERMRSHSSEFRSLMREIFLTGLSGPTEAHRAVVRTPFRAVYTTNYDCLIEDAYAEIHGRQPPVVTWKNLQHALDMEESGDFYVAKLHGCIRDEDSIILSQSEYIRLQADPAYGILLGSHFALRSNLFIGCSMSDSDTRQFLDRLHAAFPERGQTIFCLAKENPHDRLRLDALTSLYKINFLLYQEHSAIIPFLRDLSRQAGSTSDQELMATLEAMCWTYDQGICEGDAQVLICRRQANNGDWTLCAIATAMGSHAPPTNRSLVALAKAHRPEETIILVAPPVSESQRKEIEKLGAVCLTMDDLARRAADLDEYSARIAADRGPKAPGDRYVQPDYTAGGGKPRETLDDYVLRWMQEPDQRILWLLGDFGTGKTWFCRHFTQLLAEKRQRTLRDHGKRLPAPLLISLRDCRKDSDDIRQTIYEQLMHKHKVHLAAGRTTSDWLVRTGRLLLVFDGADERPEVLFSAQHLMSERCKLIVTCRNNYFESSDEFKKTAGEESQAATAVNLKGFGDRAIASAIRARRPHDWRRIETILQEWPDLWEMARRPLFMDMLLKIAGKAWAARAPTVAEVYDGYISAAIGTRSGDRQLVNALRESLERLACQGQLNQERSIQFSKEQLRDAAAEMRRDGTRMVREDILEALRARSVLIRNDSDLYEFAHLSLQEYLAASRLAQPGMGGHDIVRRHVLDPAWHEVCWIYASVCGNANAIIGACLEQAKSEPRLLFLAARSLGAARQWDCSLAGTLGDALIDLFAGDFTCAYEFLQGIYDSIRRMGPAGKESLFRHMQSPDAQIRRRCILTWFESFGHEAFKSVLPYLDPKAEDDPHVRWHAAEVLAEVALNKDLADLRRYRVGGDIITRGNVLWAHARCGRLSNTGRQSLEADVLPAIHRAVADDTEGMDLRAHGALLLGRCINALAWPMPERASAGRMLAKLLEDPDSKWRGYVARALKELGWNGAVPDLCIYLGESKDSEIWLRYAIDALERLAQPEHMANIAAIELPEQLDTLRVRLRAIIASPDMQSQQTT